MTSQQRVRTHKSAYYSVCATIVVLPKTKKTTIVEVMYSVGVTSYYVLVMKNKGKKVTEDGVCLFFHN